MRDRSGVGAALLGGAGVGKSHLLSRLYRWANEPAKGGGPRACYVYLHNILADPERLPRYLLKYVVSRLSEGGRGRSTRRPLFRLRRPAPSGTRSRPRASRPRTTLKEVHGRLPGLAFGEATGGAAAVYDVLYQFWRYARPEKADEPGRRDLAARGARLALGRRDRPR